MRRKGEKKGLSQRKKFEIFSERFSHLHVTVHYGTSTGPLLKMITARLPLSKHRAKKITGRTLPLIGTLQSVMRRTNALFVVAECTANECTTRSFFRAFKIHFPLDGVFLLKEKKKKKFCRVNSDRFSRSNGRMRYIDRAWWNLFRI